MKAVIQRVNHASVEVDGQIVGKIDRGILTLLGVEKGDTEDKIEKLLQKILNFRIFPDEQGKMNLSLLDIKGSHLVVSQFTLAANCEKGRRPSFESAAEPAVAEEFYKKFVGISASQIETQTGSFGAYMKVGIENDGPVTFIFSI